MDLGVDVPPGNEDLEDIEELLARQKDGEEDVEQGMWSKPRFKVFTHMQ